MDDKQPEQDLEPTAPSSLSRPDAPAGQPAPEVDEQATQVIDAERLSAHLVAEQVPDEAEGAATVERMPLAAETDPAAEQAEDETTVRPLGATPTPTGPPAAAEPSVPGEVPEQPVSDEELQPAMSTAEPEVGFAIASTPQVQAGEVFADRYRLEQQLAQRGGTLTWRAFDQKLSRSVLVHVMGAEDPRTPDVLEAARKAAFATDSRFLRVLDAVAGEQPGEPSLVVCEFAPGESLEKLLRQGPLSALEAAWVARELADAMAAMHAEGLFHQRINPDTVIITATGNVKIVGFLIEAAMYPDDEGGQLAWSEREHADVLAIGKLLYASLVTRWPTPREHLTGPDGQPRTTWGMSPAPMDGRGWLTPRQIRSGVSPALDVICDQVLSEAPRHNEMPLRTASQVTLALAKVLGTADAAADLERRLRYPVMPVAEADGGRPEVPGLDTTARMRAIGADEDTLGGGRGAVATASLPGQGGRASGQESSAEPGEGAGRSAAQMAAARRRDPRYRPAPRRWLALLVAVVLLSLLVGLGRVLFKRASGESGGQGQGQAQAGEVVKVTSATAFDPAADGGNAQENSGQAGLAVDGNPATAWTTVVYLNDPKLGKLKPGVGLVLDLGERRSVGSVKLTLKGSPTGVQLRVPADTGVDKAPTSSAKQWTTLTSGTATGTELTLSPEQQVQSRFVMVYLTSLPKTSGNRYQGAVAEVEVRS
ncbi:protein kinase [Luteococcus peritonei]|uniref:Protein kinase n=1 Tax=Luteococcus peritonei TaxID=88874 RepID=A0ABW4RT26_9ACTN